MIETFQTTVVEYGIVTTLLLAMVASIGYPFWKYLLQQPKITGKRSAEYAISLHHKIDANKKRK
jgi:hypothetical protein